MSALSASAAGASLLILLQLASRFVTFGINQVIIRYLSPELLGLSAQLELYLISVLYFARESIRTASQRQAKDTQAVVNLGYISLLSGPPLAIGLATGFLKGSGTGVPYFEAAKVLFGISGLIELLAEPAFLAAQQKLLYRTRALAEAYGTLTKCAITCATAVWANKLDYDVGVLPFALGQLGYAVVLLGVYIVQLWPVSSQERFSLFLKKEEREPSQFYFGYFSKPLTALGLSFVVQDIFKYFLTQGDSLLMAALGSLADLGSYTLASNYGGLIARILFQPIEESTRNLFAQLCTPDKDKQVAKSEVQQAKALLQNILRLYRIIGAIAFSVGPILAPLLFRVVAGNKWAETGAGDTLSTYCYYIPLLAINGVTEGFVASVATERDLITQSSFMGIFFIIFSGVAYTFVKTYEYGARGLIYANSINMLLRITFNHWFNSRFFLRQGEDFDVNVYLPTSLSIASTIAIIAIFNSDVIDAPSSLKLSTETFSFIGLIAVYGLSILFFERQFLLQMAAPFLRRWFPYLKSHPGQTKSASE